jgi:sterol 3beta-glucosyltransferase
MGFSPHLFPKPSDWADSIHVTGPWTLPEGAGTGDDSRDPGFVAWLEESPPVYFGFGSMPVPHHEAFIEMASEICEELGLHALIGPGWNDLKMQACDLPDNLALIEQADHAWLFPQCAAVTHHGGSGTTHAAVMAGVPSVVCPFFADQPFWGRQIHSLGLGSVLPFRKISPDRLKRALLDALDEKTQAKASAMGALMRQEKGAARAVQVLERFMLK